MTKITYALIALCLSVYYSSGQIGVGTTNPDPSSILDITSTSQGFLAPRMTQSQRDTIGWYYPCYFNRHNNNFYGGIPLENSATDYAQLLLGNRPQTT
ncbi:hypothetical protein [Flavivirga sp. 57AJ16]|uniref:hypothetical protein n=1 Tax=Flavivirga sp. 57AJ16 TaxID=3025307 RepID=UPI0023661665|nr:hypothetical protein [Flavivirga sp. 57AJ16]MDD7887460.1 hypothetical protein [Flavivirga sp. 57AJ16]